MTERTLGREQAIYRVTWIGFAVNLVLSAGKLAAGIWGHSAAMVADAIHSAASTMLQDTAHCSFWVL